MCAFHVGFGSYSPSDPYASRSYGLRRHRFRDHDVISPLNDSSLFPEDEYDQGSSLLGWRNRVRDTEPDFFGSHTSKYPSSKTQPFYDQDCPPFYPSPPTSSMKPPCATSSCYGLEQGCMCLRCVDQRKSHQAPAGMMTPDCDSCSVVPPPTSHEQTQSPCCNVCECNPCSCGRPEDLGQGNCGGCPSTATTATPEQRSAASPWCKNAEERGLIIGLVCLGVIFLILLIGVCVWGCKRSQQKKNLKVSLSDEPTGRGGEGEVPGKCPPSAVATATINAGPAGISTPITPPGSTWSSVESVTPSERQRQLEQQQAQQRQQQRDMDQMRQNLQRQQQQQRDLEQLRQDLQGQQQALDRARQEGLPLPEEVQRQLQDMQQRVRDLQQTMGSPGTTQPVSPTGTSTSIPGQPLGQQQPPQQPLFPTAPPDQGLPAVPGGRGEGLPPSPTVPPTTPTVPGQPPQQPPTRFPATPQPTTPPPFVPPGRYPLGEQQQQQQQQTPPFRFPVPPLQPTMPQVPGQRVQYPTPGVPFGGTSSGDGAADEAARRRAIEDALRKLRTEREGDVGRESRRRIEDLTQEVESLKREQQSLRDATSEFTRQIDEELQKWESTVQSTASPSPSSLPTSTSTPFQTGDIFKPPPVRAPGTPLVPRTGASTSGHSRTSSPLIKKRLSADSSTTRLPLKKRNGRFVKS